MPPLTAGQTWQINFTETCSGNPAIHYSQTGTVVDIESVTVPGGTFMALKLQSTAFWTDNVTLAPPASAPPARVRGRVGARGAAA